MKITPIRRISTALPVVLGFLAALRLSAAAPAPKAPEAKPLEVTYFFLPG